VVRNHHSGIAPEFFTAEQSSTRGGDQPVDCHACRDFPPYRLEDWIVLVPSRIRQPRSPQTLHDHQRATIFSRVPRQFRQSSVTGAVAAAGESAARVEVLAVVRLRGDTTLASQIHVKPQNE